jgi:hypothetical protein
MQVRVKRRGGDEKYLAHVLAIGTECDLALLAVDDVAFWEGLHPVELGPMPHLQEHVAVVGCACTCTALKATFAMYQLVRCGRERLGANCASACALRERALVVTKLDSCVRAHHEHCVAARPQVRAQNALGS